MPFYEYQCKNCGHDLEAMQKINDAPLKKCPHCGKSQLQRLMSAPVFRLKGGGWYETDFKGDGDNKKNLADKPEPEAPKDAPKDAIKDTAAAGADAAVKDGNGKDAKAADGTAAKDTAAKDKAVDKPAEKMPTDSAKKTGAGQRAARGRSSPRGKSAAKKPIRKPLPKTNRRR